MGYVTSYSRTVLPMSHTALDAGLPFDIDHFPPMLSHDTVLPDRRRPALPFVGHQRVFEHYLDYTASFMRAYPDVPRFAYAHLDGAHVLRQAAAQWVRRRPGRPTSVALRRRMRPRAPRSTPTFGALLRTEPAVCARLLSATAA